MKAINRTINEITLYHSTYYAQQCLRVNADNAKIVCEGINNCKSGNQKRTVVIMNSNTLKKKDMNKKS